MTQKGDGSQEKLFATLQKARDEARKSEHENTVAFVRGVTYFFEGAAGIFRGGFRNHILQLSGEKVELSGAMTLDKEEQVLARYPNAVPGLLPLEGAASKAQVKASAGRTVKFTAKATDGSGKKQTIRMELFLFSGSQTLMRQKNKQLKQ